MTSQWDNYFIDVTPKVQQNLKTVKNLEKIEIFIHKIINDNSIIKCS